MKIFLRVFTCATIVFCILGTTAQQSHACDRTQYVLDSSTFDVSTGTYTIYTTFCVGGGIIGSTRGADNSTSTFAFAVGPEIELWDIDRKQLVQRLGGDGDAPYCLVFNQDGTRLFAGDTGGKINVWSLQTGERLLTIQAHEVVRETIEYRLLGFALPHFFQLDPNQRRRTRFV